MGEVLLRPAHTETPILSLRLLPLHFLVRRLLFCPFPRIRFGFFRFVCSSLSLRSFHHFLFIVTHGHSLLPLPCSCFPFHPQFLFLFAAVEVEGRAGAGVTHY